MATKTEIKGRRLMFPESRYSLLIVRGPSSPHAHTRRSFSCLTSSSHYVNRLTAGLLRLPQTLFCLCCAELLVIMSTNRRRQSPSSPPPILEPSSAPSLPKRSALCPLHAFFFHAECISSFSFPFRGLQFARVPATPYN